VKNNFFFNFSTVKIYTLIGQNHARGRRSIVFVPLYIISSIDCVCTLGYHIIEGIRSSQCGWLVFINEAVESDYTESKSGKNGPTSCS
jgi:hypothetical protein